MSARIQEEYPEYLTKEDMKVLIELSKIHIPDDVIENAIKEAMKRNGGEVVG
jgi:hypothetical protein